MGRGHRCTGKGKELSRSGRVFHKLGANLGWGSGVGGLAICGHVHGMVSMVGSECVDISMICCQCFPILLLAVAPAFRNRHGKMV